MHMRSRTMPGTVVGFLLMLASGGCLAAVAAGTGAGAAVAYNERGVSTRMEGTVDGVFARAQAVFREMGITETSQDNDGGERELQGRSGNDLEVTVDIEADGPSLVSVNVFAQRNTVSWDRDYARSVLQAIMAR
jgi:hypothetical protein